MASPVTALVPAAGSGTRMGSELPKQMLDLGGAPVLARTLELLERAEAVEAVVVAAPPGGEADLTARCIEPFNLSKPLRVVAGGARRQDSVAAAAGAALDMGAEYVLVHDAVRPLAPPELFGAVLAAARRSGAAVAALPAVDTIKQAGGSGQVERTLERERLWQVQTPQGFALAPLLEALERAGREGFTATDEAGLIEWMGGTVELVEGARQNLKITTPEDLRLARGWLAGAYGPVRVGQGLDVHRLVEGRPLILGGVRIAHPRGLLGHSDADVLTHAVMDALLGAAGLGDIGMMFPDSEPAYAGADSLDLLSEVVARLAAEGLRPAQVSATLAAQEPRLMPHIPAMRQNLAQRLGLDRGMVNVAATTTEGLGFTGRGEGICALATATVAPAPTSFPARGPRS